MDIHAYTPLVISAIRTQVEGGYVQTSPAGVARTSRAFRLLNDLIRSCQTIVSQIGRAVDMPKDTRDEIATQVSRIMIDAQRASDAMETGHGINVGDHVIAAATYLEALAAQLRASGMNGMAGADSVSAGIVDAARRLTAAVGGSTGGSGGSNI